MGFRLRSGNAGQVVRGTQDGQALIWSESDQEWEPTLIDSSELGVYTFATYEDLEAAFPALAGVHTLDEAAVYQFTGDGFSMPNGARILVTATGAVLDGNAGAVIASAVTDGPVCEFTGARQTVYNVAFSNTDTTASDVRCAVECSAGDQAFYSSTFVVAGDAPAFLLNGASTSVYQSNCRYSSGATTAARACVRIENGTFAANTCREIAGVVPFVNLANQCQSLTLINCTGDSSENRPSFLRIAGTCGEMLLSCCHMGAHSDAAIQYVSGAVGFASVMGCTAYIGGGISWPAANIPSRGLMVLGCNFSGGFDGFTETDARVNVKACSDNSGLLAETPIVA